MSVTPSTLLSLPLITSGTESGVWGNWVNNGLTSYLDNAIAGTVTLTNDGAVTLSNTAGTDTVTNIVSSLTGAGTVSAQFAIIRVTGTLTTAKVLTAPSLSKTFVVVNAATGSTVTIKASGQSGVSVAVGETATVYFNGTDYVKSTSITTATGVLGVANGGTGLTSTPANGALDIGNGTGFTRTTLTAGTGITVTNASGAITIAASGSVSAATPTALGTVYGKVDTSLSNFSVGQNALGGGSLTGSQNTALGASALISNSSGGYNTAVGYAAGYGITTGSQNILIGYQAGWAGGANLTTGSNNIVIGYNATASLGTVSNEVTIGNISMTSTRLYGMVALNMAMFEQATVSATAATGTVQYDARTQSVLYYTSNASGNWNLNLRASNSVSLDSAMAVGQSLTIAFLVTNGSTAYYQALLLVDGTTVTPKWQGGTAPTSGNASAVDVYVITVIKTASATFSAFASQTKFA